MMTHQRDIAQFVMVDINAVDINVVFPQHIGQCNLVAGIIPRLMIPPRLERTLHLGCVAIDKEGRGVQDSVFELWVRQAFCKLFFMEPILISRHKVGMVDRQLVFNVCDFLPHIASVGMPKQHHVLVPKLLEKPLHTVFPLKGTGPIQPDIHIIAGEHLPAKEFGNTIL